MPTSFVSLIYLYSVGFDKLEELDDEEIEALYKLRENEIENMLELQFMLSYFCNITKADSDEMTPFELKNWYRLLKKQKELEDERGKKSVR